MVVGGALDDMMVVVSVESLKGNVFFLTQPLAAFGCSGWRGDEGSPKKTEHNDFFSCERGLSMLTGRRYQKTSSPLVAEGGVINTHKIINTTISGVAREEQNNNGYFLFFLLLSARPNVRHRCRTAWLWRNLNMGYIP